MKCQQISFTVNCYHWCPWECWATNFKPHRCRPANLWIPECGTSNFGMRDTKMAYIVKHSKQNDKMRDIPRFQDFFIIRMRDCPSKCGTFGRSVDVINLIESNQVSEEDWKFLVTKIAAAIKPVIKKDIQSPAFARQVKNIDKLQELRDSDAWLHDQNSIW